MTAALAAYAAASAGIPAATAAAAAIGRAGPQVAEILSETAADDEIDLGESCGYRVVASADGPVPFEDGYGSYEPDRDLVPIVFALAAAIEGEGTYRVEQLGIADDLPPVWVAADADKVVAAALESLTGCASVRAVAIADAGRNPRDHFLLVFVAEAATAEDATAVAQGANRGGRLESVVLGVAVGRLCAILIAACVHAGRPSFERTETIARFRPMVYAAFG